MAEDEINISELGANGGIICTEAETGEVFGVEVGGDRLEAVVPAARAFSAETGFSERQVEIIADDGNIFWRDLIISRESLDGFARVIVKSLRFEENDIARFVPKGVVFGFFPVKMMDFGVKIKQKKAEVMSSKVIF